MARQPTLTINVNSQQFQQFAKNFAQFSGQIKQLNQQFAQINAQLNKTNIVVRAVNASMNVLLNITKSVGSQVLKITKQFISWSAIIGGITALLGMGGGLFGIERLAASILAKRRQVLGLGGDYGRTQASMIYSQSLLSSPGNVLGNIRQGLGGSPDQMTFLAAMGIPFGTKMSPDQVLDKILEKLPAMLKAGGPGTELMTAQALKATSVFGIDDLLRMTTKEGMEEIRWRRKLIEQYKDQMKISPRATKAWAELEMQFQAAKAQLESVFGERLADLAEPLKHLSDSFAHLIQVLMQSPVVQKMIKWLAQQIEWLANKMKELREEDLEKFIAKIQSWLPSMDEMKSVWHDFVEVMKGAYNVLKWLLPYAQNPVAAASQGLGAGWINDKLRQYIPSDQDILHKLMPGTFPAPNQAPTAQSPSTTAPTAPTPPTAPSAFGGGATPFNTFGGFGGGLGGPMSQTGQGATGFGWQQSVGVPAPGLGMNTWPAAASRMSPNAGSFGDRFGNWVGGGTFGGRGWNREATKPGPLSSNNWQMNRTANLIVRNVPGANIFMSAVGLSG